MKKGTMNVRDLTHIAIISSLYVILTIAISPISFGGIQFRFSEILVLLCFYDKKYMSSLVIGCFISNLFSPGILILDILFGTLHTLVSVYFVSRCKKNLAIASIFPALFSFIVAIGISISYEIPYFITTFQVMIGELVVVLGIGYPLFKMIEKNRPFMNKLKIEKVSENSLLSSLDYFSVVLLILLILISFTVNIIQDKTLVDLINDNLILLSFYILMIFFFVLILFKKSAVVKIIKFIILTLSFIILIMIVINQLIVFESLLYFLLIILLGICNYLTINNYKDC